MKKTFSILSAVLLSAMIFSSFREFSPKVFSSENPIKEVTIGSQVWMAENLNVDKFRNGDPIPQAKTVEEWKKAMENGQPAWSYYDNDPANGQKYGKLYNWFAVNDPRGLAPAGWHVASDTEWTKLIDYLGGLGAAAGIKMKTTSGWKNNGNGNNESGFTALPGGTRFPTNGNFANIGKIGYFWTSTELYSTIAYQRTLNSEYVSRGDSLKGGRLLSSMYKRLN